MTQFISEMAESIVPLRKKIKDSLTRQEMWNIRGLHRKGLAEREEKERVLSSENIRNYVFLQLSKLLFISRVVEHTIMTFMSSILQSCKISRLECKV